MNECLSAQRRGLVSILKKHPLLYRLLQRIYAEYLRFCYCSKSKLRHLAENLLGTVIREKEWAMKNSESAERYWSGRSHPSKYFFEKNVFDLNFYPTSILEIGSNCGPNLYRLAKKFPRAEIVGIDVNKIAVQKGNEWFAQEGISNVKLLTGRADDLGQFNNKSFDVVFTWAVLLLVGPDKIKKVMKEMIRIVHRKLILIELYGRDLYKDPHGLGIYSYVYWKRDYAALLRQFIPNFPQNKIHINKCPDYMWMPGGGEGTIIEFIME